LLDPVPELTGVAELLVDVLLERLAYLLRADAVGVDRVRDVAHHRLDLHPVGLHQELDDLLALGRQLVGQDSLRRGSGRHIHLRSGRCSPGLHGNETGAAECPSPRPVGDHVFAIGTLCGFGAASFGVCSSSTPFANFARSCFVSASTGSSNRRSNSRSSRSRRRKVLSTSSFVSLRSPFTVTMWSVTSMPSSFSS